MQPTSSGKRPLPVFPIGDVSVPSSKKKCPPAPNKKNTNIQKLFHCAIEIHAAESTKKEYALLAQGDFKEVYIFSETILRKVYGEKARATPHLLEGFTRHQMAQYFLLRDHLPVSKILNDPAKDGYFEVQWIPFSVKERPLSWKDKNITFDSLDQANKKLLEQVRAFFDFAIENNRDPKKRQAFDFKPDNFQMNSNNILYLIDFMEDNIHDDTPTGFMCPAFAQWSSKNPSIAEYLLENIKNIDDEAYNLLNNSII